MFQPTVVLQNESTKSAVCPHGFVPVPDASSSQSTAGSATCAGANQVLRCVVLLRRNVRELLNGEGGTRRARAFALCSQARAFALLLLAPSLVHCHHGRAARRDRTPLPSRHSLMRARFAGNSAQG